MILADYGKHLVLLDGNVRAVRAAGAVHPGLARAPRRVDPRLQDRRARPRATSGMPGWLTEANHLGNVAYRAGKKLEWDAVAMRATNAPAADKFLRREDRAGWSLTTS